MRIADDDRIELIAEFAVDPVNDQLTLVLESAGGGTGAGHARNQDYVPALRLLLERLRRLNGRILDGVVDSMATAHLALSERRLNLRDRVYPIFLAEESDIESVRLALTTPQGRIGRRPGGKGGNNRKRLRLFLEVPGFGPADAAKVAKELASPQSSKNIEGNLSVSSPEEASPHWLDKGFQTIPVEGAHIARTTYERSARTIVVMRSESALVHTYLCWLEMIDSPSRSKSAAGTTDLIVIGADGVEILEAKSTARHQHVRLALGQLLDYAASTPPPVSRLTALFPDLPSSGDVGLLHRYGVDVVHHVGSRFVRIEAPSHRRDHMNLPWNHSVDDQESTAHVD